jgi:6-hydroxytryprostatin B O-methyltransferase
LRFDIAQAIPADGSISAEDLASKVGLPLDILNRVVRYAITNGIFREPSKGKYAHSNISAYVAKNEHVRDIASIATQELSIMNLNLAEALTQQKATGGKSPAAAFNIAYPDFATAFEFIGSDPGRGQRYHKYLAGRTQQPLWDVEHLVSSWNWAEKIGSGTLVDVSWSRFPRSSDRNC